MAAKSKDALRIMRLFRTSESCRRPPLKMMNLHNTRQLHCTNQSYGAPAVENTVPLSPAVRYLVYTHNISDLTSITATGPRQRLLKGDILQYIQDVKDGKATLSDKQPTIGAATKPLPKKPVLTVPNGSGVTYTDIPIDSNRVTAAQQVARHKASTPHAYVTASCSLDQVSQLGYSGPALTAFFVKAAALTVQRLPESNYVWSDIDPKPLSSASVSVISGGRTIRVGRATAQSVDTISKIIQDDSTVESHASKGSSVSLYHLDSVLTYFTSITDPTSPSILCIGGTQLTLNEQGLPSKSITVTMATDTRVMDYELSCQWLQTFCSIVETPETTGLL